MGLRLTTSLLVALFGAATALGQEISPPAAPVSPLNWTLALRGGYEANRVGGGKADLALLPELALKLGSARAPLTLNAGGELAIDGTGAVGLANLHVGATTQYKLDTQTTLSGGLTATLKPATVLLAEGTTLTTAPFGLSGVASLGLARKFGRFQFDAGLEAERYIQRPAVLDTGQELAGLSESFWRYGTNLRLGYEVLPLVSAFVEGGAGHGRFDAVSPQILTPLDNRTYEVRAGFAHRLGPTLNAEISVGRAFLDFDDPRLTDDAGWVYGAVATYAPDPTLSLSGSLATNVAPSKAAPGTADFVHKLGASAKYDLNPWLTLRGTANLEHHAPANSDRAPADYGLGAGLDWKRAARATWSADYSYAHKTLPAEDTHRVELSLKIAGP